MPIYEYKCCVEVEVVKSISDESDEPCPVCGKPMERLVSVGSFVIKGYAPSRDIKRTGKVNG